MNEKPAQSGSPWDKLEDEEVIIQAKSGMDIEEIAKQHEKTIYAIKMRLSFMRWMLWSEKIKHLKK